MKKLLVAAIILMSACSQQEEKKVETTVGPDPAAEKMATGPSNKELVSAVDNKYDPVCGMPVSAGVSDTLRHEGKLLGFCAPECMDEFAKNPKEYTVEYVAK